MARADARCEELVTAFEARWPSSSRIRASSCSTCARKAWLSARSAAFSASTSAIRLSAVFMSLCSTCRASPPEQSPEAEVPDERETSRDRPHLAAEVSSRPDEGATRPCSALDKRAIEAAGGSRQGDSRQGDSRQGDSRQGAGYVFMAFHRSPLRRSLVPQICAFSAPRPRRRPSWRHASRRVFRRQPSLWPFKRLTNRRSWSIPNV